MFSFLNEISFLNKVALWGLASLSIPIIIHLFNTSRGKLVIVGSIELIKKAKVSRVTKIKLAQYLLLIIRICLLLVACFILAELALKGAEKRTKETVYLTPGWINTASDIEINQLEINHKNADILILQENAPAFEASLSQSIKSKVIFDVINSSAMATLIGQLNTIKHEGVVHVYSTNSQAEYPIKNTFQGLAINWHFKDIMAIDVPQLQLSIGILSDVENKEQINHLIKAIEEINRGRNIQISIQELTTNNIINALETNFDWLIGFNSNPITNATIQSFPSTTKVLMIEGYSSSNGIRDNISLANYPFSTFDIEIKNIPPTGGRVLWETNIGQPLLARKFEEDKEYYYFSSSLTLSATSLVERPDFPIVLLSLLTYDNPLQRDIFATIATDQFNEKRAENTPYEYPATPLYGWLVFLLVLLFVIERWYSERVSNDPA